EADLRKTKREAEAASRAKSEFLAAMSHELRTPLNAIIGFSDVMNAETFGSLGHERYQAYARDIHASGVHLPRPLNDILDMSRIEAGGLQLRPQRVDLAEVVGFSCQLVRERAEHAGVLLAVEGMAGPPIELLADEIRLRQILLNLLSNSIKFTPA